MDLRRSKPWPLVAAILTFTLHGAAAAAPPALPDACRQWFEDAVARGAASHVAVGLLQQGEEATWFFGGTDGATPAVDRNSVFEIGALTDVFTGVLAARAVVEGKLRLNASLAAALPDTASAGDGLAAVTVDDLVTQRSGLPPTPQNLFPANLDDPYADYRHDDLAALLGHLPAPAAAGQGRYSPLNSSVLGLVLARTYASEYPLLLFERVLVPLGMSHSGFGDPDPLLQGHSRGEPVPHWHYGALAPAAGLRTSLGDLLAFARASLAPDASPLRAALLLARQPRAQDSGGGLAFGWRVHDVAMGDQTWPLAWRASETGGFSAFIGFRTDRQQALVLLADATLPLAPVGLAWLGEQELPAPPPARYLPAPGQLERYPGLYRLLDGREITIRVDGAALLGQLRGSPPFPLLAVADDVYASAGGAVGITFVRNIDHISGLLLRANGTFVTAQRLSERAPRLERHPLAIGAAALREYIGDYRIDDELMLRVAADAGSLSMQFSGGAAIPLQAYAADRFAAEDGVDGIVFRRDEAGHIAAVTVLLGGGERSGEPVHWRAP